MLSSRLPKDLSPSPFFAELERAKACAKKGAAEGGLSFIDMTVSSPVKAGLPVEMDAAVETARKDFGCWNPDAAGWKSAREAVVEYYRERGGNFTAGQIILTASTSEAYSVLFKTFCDPGDVILTPMPGYPLLDTLAQHRREDYIAWVAERLEQNRVRFARTRGQKDLPRRKVPAAFAVIFHHRLACRLPPRSIGIPATEILASILHRHIQVNRQARLYWRTYRHVDKRERV
jgi:hypothetical protein